MAALVGWAGRENPPKLSPLQRRIDWLASACALTPAQSSAFGLLARATLLPKVMALIEAVTGRFGLDLAVLDGSDLGAFLEGDVADDELSCEGRLAQLGLIDARDGARLSYVARRILTMPRLAARRVGDLLLGQPAAATLRWDDFVHLDEMRELAARMVLTAGGSRGRAGVNLLFYGPPGTGKTEFAKSLGEHVGFSVQFVGETNDKSGEPSRSERLAALLANAIGAVARRTILVVDEADDLFDTFNDASRRGSKVFLNRLLERSAAPTIWIANDPDRLGPAIVRRMNLALRFPKPRLSVRNAMMGAIAESHGLRLDEDSKLILARAHASPAAIDNAIRTAALIGGSAGDATSILQAGLLVSGGSPPLHFPMPMPFDPALSSADVDLVAFADRVAQSRSLALSFLLSGPPGAGKSAFARHLAERLDLELVEKRYSDLVSMWLGESEKAIGRAFEEAADLRAFLVFDEADSLLRDRAAAQHSWEVTQVNEMLTRMERHHRQGACKRNQLACSRRIDFPGSRQQADDNAVRAFGLRGFDVCPHGLELIVIEQEVSAARPDHHVEIDTGHLPRLTDRAAAWRNAALQQIGAELDALSPRSLCGADAADRIHTYLVDHRALPVANALCRISA